MYINVGFFAGAVNSVAVSPDCKTFSSSSYDKTIRVWRISDASCIHVLEGKIYFNTESNLSNSFNFVSVSMIFQLDIGTVQESVPTVWYFLFFILF